MQVDPQVLHYASVLYDAGADVQDDALATQAPAVADVPWQGPSFAVKVGQESKVPVNDAQG